jgi:hypothetical protein
MKIVSICALSILFLASCGGAKNENTVELGKSYGPVKVDTSKAVSVAEMLKAYEGKTEEMEFTLEAPIQEVCSKAGCWINVDKGNGETFMVRFKDHFTIPPKTKVGTEAYIHGVAYMDTISVDLLRHFAEDAGKSKEEIEKITEPEFELGFEADGITLKK